MRADLLVWGVHAVITWVLVRMLASLAVSSGAQSLWALASALVVAVTTSGILTTWLTRSHGLPRARLARRLLPAPVAGAVLTAVVVVLNGASPAQTTVASLAWVVGAALGISIPAARRSPREDPA